jgi:hypothetical protein
MPHDPFSSFDPNAITMLRSVFDDVWKGIELNIREVIATALLDLAKAGQRDPMRLKAYAADKAREALSALPRAHLT